MIGTGQFNHQGHHQLVNCREKLVNCAGDGLGTFQVWHLTVVKQISIVFKRLVDFTVIQLKLASADHNS